MEAATLSPMVAHDTAPKVRNPFSSATAMTVPVAKALQSFSAPETNAAHIKGAPRS